MVKMNRLMAAMAVAGLAMPFAAHATDGMFSSGYGMTANGMGGAATAMAEDAFGGANNPASMAFVGNRLDLGASLFSPRRSASVYQGTPSAYSESSDANYFIIPEFGYNHMVTKDVALGVSMYGNGGMNTDFAPMANGYNFFGGKGNLGVNLIQMIVAPTASWKINDNNSIGIAPLLAYQQFTAQGLSGFEGFSSNPTHMTNTGTDSSTCVGVRVGYMGKITPTLTFGAQYASKITMSKMSDYSGLFANQGELDMPENYSVGLAWKTTKDLTLALDYQEINYSGVAAIGDSSSVPLPFGATNGPGFGWQDIGVWKLGAEYKYNDNWTLRAGWNHCDNPVTASNVQLNVLAPGVIEDHITLGGSYTTASGNEWTFAYIHAFQNSLSGAGTAYPGGVPTPYGTDTIRMYQDTVGIEYTWKL